MLLLLQLRFSALVLSVNIFLHFPLTNSQATGWFKVCGMSEDKVIQSTTCSKGIWLNKPMNLDCVCVKGVWALSTGFCDTQWSLIVGDGDCFQISDKIRSIKFMGKPDEPFASSTFTGPLDLSRLVQISGGTSSESFEANNSVVIGINPINPVQRSDQEICLSKGTDPKPVHVYLNTDVNSNQWQTLYTQDCPKATNYQFHVDIGEMYKDSAVISKRSAAGSCQETCSIHQQSVSEYNNSTILGGIPRDNLVHVNVPFKIKPGSPDEKKLDCLTSRGRVTQDPEQYEMETKQQTIRMMGAHLKPLLLNVSAFEVNTKEYQYFGRAFTVFKKACASGSEEANITSAISKMWGWLIGESHNLFTHAEGQDEKMHERVMLLLDQCINNSSLKITENKVLESPESCIKNVTGGKGTNFNETETVVTDNLPPYLKFDKGKFDLVIDVAWKIVLITHYRCANVFSKGGLPFELSYLMDKLQSFFNTKIIKRWHDSKDAYSIYKFMLFGYDLDAFPLLVDRCLAFSKELSEIPHWFLRPKIPCTENDLSNQRPKRSVGGSRGRGLSRTLKQVWDSNGYCIKEFVDPILKLNYDSYNDCLKATNSNPKLGNDRSKKRKTRFRFGIHYE